MIEKKHLLIYYNYGIEEIENKEKNSGNFLNLELVNNSNSYDIKSKKISIKNNYEFNEKISLLKDNSINTCSVVYDVKKYQNSKLTNDVLFLFDFQSKNKNLEDVDIDSETVITQKDFDLISKVIKNKSKISTKSILLAFKIILQKTKILTFSEIDNLSNEDFSTILKLAEKCFALILSNCNVDSILSSSSIFTSLHQNITNICLDQYYNLKNTDLKSIAEYAPFLTILCISDATKMSAEDWLLLSNISNIEYISLVNCKSITDKVILNIIKKCRKLKYIDLTDSDQCLSERVKYQIALINNDLLLIKKMIIKRYLNGSEREEKAIKEICKNLSSKKWIDDNIDFLKVLIKENSLPMENIGIDMFPLIQILKSGNCELCLAIVDKFLINEDIFNFFDTFLGTPSCNLMKQEKFKNIVHTLEQSNELLKNVKESNSIDLIYNLCDSNKEENNNTFDTSYKNMLSISMLKKDYKNIIFFVSKLYEFNSISGVTQPKINFLLDKVSTQIESDGSYLAFEHQGAKDGQTALYLAAILNKIIQSKDNKLEDDLIVEGELKKFIQTLALYSKWNLDIVNYGNTGLEFIAQEIVDVLKDKSVDFPILIPAGDKTHVISICIEKSKGTMTLCNTGKGLKKFHRQKKGKMTEYETQTTIKNIAEYAFCNVELIKSFLSTNLNQEIDNTYDTFNQFKKYGDEVKEIDWEFPQIRGTCPARNKMHVLSRLIKNVINGPIELKNSMALLYKSKIYQLIGVDHYDDIQEVEIQLLVDGSLEKHRGNIELVQISRDEKMFNNYLKKSEKFLNKDLDKDKLDNKPWYIRYQYLKSLITDFESKADVDSYFFNSLIEKNSDDKLFLEFFKSQWIEKTRKQKAIRVFLNRCYHESNWSSLKSALDNKVTIIQGEEKIVNIWLNSHKNKNKILTEVMKL